MATSFRNAEDKTGKPLVVFRKERGKYRLQSENLKSILCRGDVMDRPVMILSIAGALREGKSFILNFIIRYLRFSRADDWLGDASSALDGFSWKGGLAANTMGILMWSEPFLIDTGDGKVAIILMDTQGLFDDESSMDEVKTIFCMSFLLCSFQVYNVMKQIKDDMMQCFTTFLEYAKMAKMPGEQHFLLQRLLFLIRDWPNELTHGYGTTGGEQYIQEYLNSSVSFASNSSRSNLKKAAEEIHCFLLPTPGRRVCETRRNQAPFVGALKDIDRKFLATLPELMEMFFCTKNIVPKTLNGQVLTGKDVMAYAKRLDELFSKDALPKAEDITTTIKLAFYGALKEEFLKKFREEMNEISESGETSEHSFLERGKLVFSNLLNEYDERPKYEGTDKKQRREEIYRILENELQVYVQKFKNKMENLRKQCSSLAAKECKSKEIQLQKKFGEVCVMRRVLKVACDDIAKTSSTNYPDAVRTLKLENYFRQLVLVGMDRVKQAMLNQNDAKLRTLEATCKNMKSRCVRFAEEEMDKKFQETVWSNAQVPRLKRNIVSATSRRWDILADEQRGPEEILGKHKKSLLDSVEGVLRQFEREIELSKERLDKEASQEVDDMIEKYNSLMAKKMGRTSHERKDLERFHALSCDGTANSTRLRTLKPYVEKKAKQLWDHRVQDELKEILQQNSFTEQVERQLCESTKAKCIKKAGSFLEEECGRQFFSSNELKRVVDKIKDKVMQEFYRQRPTHRPSIFMKPQKDLERYFEYEFVKQATERNQKNEIMMSKEIDAVRQEMKTECGRLFTGMLSEDDPDLTRVERVEDIARNRCDQILDKCTDSAKKRCREIKDEVIMNEREKYEARRKQLTSQKGEAIEDLILKCPNIYRQRMAQYMLGSTIDESHEKASSEVEGIIIRSPLSDEGHVRDKIFVRIKEAKDELLKNERHKEEKIANAKQQLIKLFRSTMENKLRGASCSKSLLEKYESEVLGSVNENRKKLNVTLRVSTKQLLEPEMREIRRRNDEENMKFKKRCEECTNKIIDEYEALTKSEQERLAKNEAERQRYTERKIQFFRREVGRGNLDTITEYCERLKNSLLKVSSDRRSQGLYAREQYFTAILSSREEERVVYAERSMRTSGRGVACEIRQSFFARTERR